MTLRYILFGLFTITFYIIAVYFSIERKRVLVLHSYSPDYAWTRDVEIGMRRVFGSHSFFTLRSHYMDTKNHPEAPFIEKAILKAKEVIKLMEPDILIAVDDDAQRVAKTYLNHPRLSIIFTGVNGSPAMYGYDKAFNVTGILERLPLRGLQDTLRLLGALSAKQPTRVTHLSDASLIVRLDDAYIHAYQWDASIQLMPSHLVETFDEWKKAVYQCNKEVDYILISNYRKIYKDAMKTNLVPPRTVMDWTMQNATVPVIGMNGFVAEDGAHLAVSTSPYEQGIVAAQMALSILTNQKKPAQIPVAQTQQFIISLKQGAKELSNLPIIYESFARYADRYYVASPAS